ncbi:MAG: hypothetical protein MUE50_24575 [Pirellulaceae bacterium]|nr:hypothetical protein [Pirellulaceae bacterium]
MLAQSRSPSFWTASAVLTLVIVAVFPVFAGIGHWRAGWSGVAAAGAAAGVCWAGGFLALIAAGLFRSSGNAVNGILVGMACRTGLPLVAGVILHTHGGALAAAGVFAMILGYYLVTLAAETWLAIRVMGASKRDSETEVV